jgi:uncharacterized membrane protein
MKKQSILFLAGGLMALASCNNGGQNAGMSQAQVDSMVNVKVQEMTVQMQAKNDSSINALAQAKADSMINAMKGASASAAPAPSHHSSKPAATPTPAPAPQPATVGNGKPDMRNQGNAQQSKDKTIGNGKPSMK